MGCSRNHSSNLGLLMEPHRLIDTASARVTVILACAVQPSLEISTAWAAGIDLILLKVWARDAQTGKSCAFLKVNRQWIGRVLSIFDVELTEEFLIQSQVWIGSRLNDAIIGELAGPGRRASQVSMPFLPQH